MKINTNVINITDLLDAMIVFGFVLDKGMQLNQNERNQLAKAKLIMIAEWMLLAFLLSLSYRSVLLSTIVSPGYEKPIDTIQDMLEGDRSIFVLNGTTLAKLLRQDPKEDVRRLSRKVTYYEVNENGTHPQWILDRYVNCYIIVKVNKSKSFIFQEFEK